MGDGTKALELLQEKAALHHCFSQFLTSNSTVRSSAALVCDLLILLASNHLKLDRKLQGLKRYASVLDKVPTRLSRTWQNLLDIAGDWIHTT